MKTIYIDAGMGAAGDMLTAALLELTPDRESTLRELNAMALPHVEYTAHTVEKCGITGTKVHVLVHGQEEGMPHDHREHDHHSLENIEEIIRRANADEAVKADALAVYQLLAQAESRVHGVPMAHIHFHEVGSMDAVADIMAVCFLLHKLGAPRVIASPVNVGSGTVQCAHGILPVPAPATALLLEGIPMYSGNDIRGELCTPTGAALLKHFAERFAPLPLMQAEKIGYGMGTKDFPTANCLRAFLGAEEAHGDEVIELRFNIDDMTGEEIAFGTEELLRGGAKDVFCTPVQMKKNRPATLVTAVIAPADREAMLALIFRHFTTLGVRETLCARYTLGRRITAVETPFGTVRRKDAVGWGQTKSKYEYEDLARAAREHGCGIRDILAALEHGETL